MGIIILASFVGGVFATTSPTAPSGNLTPQTTSVDIDALSFQLTPGIYTIGTGVGAFSSVSSGVNVTAAFSFAPVKGFTQVNSVLLTVTYNFVGGGNLNDALSIELNGHSPILLPPTSVLFTSGISAATPISGMASVPVQAVRVGTNTVNVGVLRGGTSTSIYTVFQIRLTVEYTFLA